MFRSLQAESDICSSDQHDFSGEVFGHKGHGMSPLFSQELEEGAFDHEASRALEVT